MSSPVPRIARVLDALALLLFLFGAGIAGWAWLQLRRLRQVQPTSEGIEFTAVARADRLSELSWVGVALMAGGVALAVTAAGVARRLAGDGPEEPDPDASGG